MKKAGEVSLTGLFHVRAGSVGFSSNEAKWVAARANLGLPAEKRLHAGRTDKRRTNPVRQTSLPPSSMRFSHHKGSEPMPLVISYTI
ncbi:hypothetical protein HLH36_05310 [Gluconacetobacter aggeris]|uniref:Uncharacterized protein n=1 Tax=Gluconacetobacter aggeris TaxID=1286186 RepID=A0A7W4IRR5_9PROT|nr:hypothetical protein [Gluconacetobacter aggeris]MBB2167778.1 hypothetical protein [Gluconacetobacter aggeris]